MYSFDDILGLPSRKRKRTLTAADKKRVAANQGWKCKKCKKPLPARFHVDHKKRFSEGGSDSISNLQALCPNCHAQKTENERHRAKQKKTHKSEQGNQFGLTLSPPTSSRRRKSDNPFDLSLDLPSKTKRKKSKKNPFDLGF